ncbi:NADH-quinone oxidoreductase subunit C [Geochorda subterranea]|uniref:NADH-quinone oxidoreductase subunit C n=1 Tax=Geochorda subterranea TaxID=3109564 RepID=A0ABZ1BM59_9FIRM|nr:NADH-quinone oxidoreductase subunit C [Limnochorda sp. LNt]WRP13613.1 NADH-quinone oxidoreductase subunit C [Limnochorda sp. LNt]
MAGDGVRQGAATPAVEASERTVQRLVARFGPEVEPLPTPFDVPVVKVRPGALREVAALLKEAGYAMLLDVGGVDYLGRRPPEERFEVVYHLLDVRGLRRIRLRVPVPEDRPEVPTLSDLWPSASWAEREVFDLFGIRFTGHPDLRRILMPDDWEGHPLRKDFPLRGSRQAGTPQALRQRFFPLRLDGPPGDAAPGSGGDAPAGRPGAGGEGGA